MALAGGITNRNYRLRWGGRDCVLRMPGKDTALLGIDRARGVGGDPRGGGGRHRPARARVRAGPRLPRHGVRRGPPGRAAGAARRASRSSPRRCARSTPAGRCPRAFDAFAVVEQYRAHRRARAAPTPPPGFGELADGARAIRAALTGPEHAPVPCHNDLLTREPARRRPAAADPRLGVRGHGRPLLRPRQPRGQQRLHRGRRRGAARRLLARRLHAAGGSPRCG